MTANTTDALVDLLGDTRAELVNLLRSEPRSVAELAAAVGVSEVAVRRHLHVLERDGLVSAETVRRDGPGRPGARYELTAKARRLFPDRSAEFANELLDFLTEQHGRSALREFLRWRSQRQGERYAATMSAAEPADIPGRVAVLADLLDRDGFVAEASEVDSDGQERVLALRQGHCAIAEVAEAHPEVCAYEAALFRDVLGAKVSRRQTIAGGANECVCHVVIDEVGEPQERNASDTIARSASDDDR